MFKKKYLFFLFLLLIIQSNIAFSQFLLSNGGRIDIRLYRDFPGTVFAGIFVDFHAPGLNNGTSDDTTLGGNIDESLFSWPDDSSTRLGIQRRAVPVLTDVVRLEITQYRVVNYTLTFSINSNTNGFFNGYTAPILHDKFLNTYTLLNLANNVYSYTIEATPSNHPSRDARRFDIVFDVPNTCESSPTLTGSPLTTSFAISTLNRSEINPLISNRNNGALLLESKNKALIIPRISDQSLITNPVEGMMFFDTTTNNLKVHDGTGWKILSKCN